VFFRDFQNIVATLTIFTHWAVPMIYPFAKLKESSMGGTWIEQVYLLNPLSEAVLLMQRCFWIPTTPPEQDWLTRDMPADLFTRGLIMLGVSVLVLLACQRLFARLEGSFAERL
jgi:ABC-2 type transport system permease protein